jgi:asparagine synthase (glutamine-hydrolysing)
MVFDNLPECDEREFSIPVVHHCGLDAAFVRPNAKTLLDRLDDALSILETPVGAEGILNFPLIAAARSIGCNTLLTGLDGDRVMSMGWGCLDALAQERLWPELFEEILVDSRISFPQKPRAFLSCMMRGFPVGRKAALVLRRRRRNTLPTLKLIQSAALAHIDRVEVEQQLVQLVTPLSTPSEYHARRLNSWERAEGFEFTDLVHSHFGVDAQHPYMDRRLVDFALSLPREQRLRHGRNRHIVRHAFRNRLPRGILERRRKRFLTGFLKLLAREAVHRYRKGAIGPRSLIWVYVDPKRFLSLCGRIMDAKATIPDVRQVVRSFAVARWLDFHAAGSPMMRAGCDGWLETQAIPP